MAPQGLKIALVLPAFYVAPFEKIAFEVGPVTGWTYLMHKGRVVAIAVGEIR